MNDFSELEAELKKLRLAPISDELTRRIARALAQPEPAGTAGILPRPRSNHWWSLGLGLTGLAALLVIGLTFFDRTPMPQNVANNVSAKTPAPSLSGFQPAGLSQVVYSGRDEGLVFPPNDKGAPRHRLRYETRETISWRNASTGASVRVSYPAEQVVLTPVSFQ